MISNIEVWVQGRRIPYRNSTALGGHHCEGGTCSCILISILTTRRTPTNAQQFVGKTPEPRWDSFRSFQRPQWSKQSRSCVGWLSNTWSLRASSPDPVRTLVLVSILSCPTILPRSERSLSEHPDGVIFNESASAAELSCFDGRAATARLANQGWGR